MNSFLKPIVDNEATMGALRALCNEVLAENLPNKEMGDHDAVLGQKYRAYKTAEEIVDKMFDKLEALQSVSSQKVEGRQY